ncbi:twin-arginine translocation signal domain-containing protein [Ralstonia solanacearum]|uniref:twin-arginine translocation signal domain-containing protein n=1 Tax=Ralstonia solanacearum TaxID=305 RepID=UPI0006DCEBA8|nr:twin-arginine translocation signal domain-containing protein [Ralstonia solanacearum]
MPDPKPPHAPVQADASEAAPTRRRFLMGAAVAAAAATAGRLVPPPAPDVTTEPADDKVNGYRLTEHIRKYYKTTWI